MGDDGLRNKAIYITGQLGHMWLQLRIEHDFPCTNYTPRPIDYGSPRSHFINSGLPGDSGSEVSCAPARESVGVLGHALWSVFLVASLKGMR